MRYKEFMLMLSLAMALGLETMGELDKAINGGRND